MRLTILTLAALAAAATAPLAAQQSSSQYLSRLPDGDEKRRFILDCTGCHQFDSVTVGRRTRDDWADAVQRMLGFSGATSNFPVISAYRDAARTADWLAQSLAAPSPAAHGTAPAASRAAPREGRAEVTEFPLSSAQDLLHDVAVDSSGRIIVTGMFTSRMFVLDPATGQSTIVPTPAPGPRAVELDAQGRWWVLLGGPRTIARYDPRTSQWASFPIGMYPHSIGLDARGRAWFNGHFTRNPEQLGYVDSAGAVQLFNAPANAEFSQLDGGPIPYELRLGPDGRVWMSELQGNRIVALDPATGQFQQWLMPRPFSGPRRLDIARDGTVWIPAYSGNALVRLDPRSGRMEEFAFPEPDVLPYVARVDQRSGDVWIGTAAADAAYRFEPRSRQFTRYALPSRGAMVRHMAIDPRNGEVWLAYGASPGRIPAMVARLSVSR